MTFIAIQRTEPRWRARWSIIFIADVSAARFTLAADVVVIPREKPFET